MPQLAALAQVRRLDQLTIHPEGNPAVNLALWRPFVIYRLNHFNLQKINGQEVRCSTRVTASNLCRSWEFIILVLDHYRE